MQTHSRTVRIFLSSTFRDFAEERDLLVRKVFPELRRKCRQRQVELIDVDLRWGITEEEAQQGKVLPICLSEIDRSRPFFMGFIGERYGWVPERDQYDLSLLMEQPWLESHRGGKSVTELEILHGVLNNPAMSGRAFFYFRDSKWSRAQGGFYLSEGTEEKAKLDDLKDRIRKSDLPVVENYRSPVELAERIKDDLWKLIDSSFPQSDVPDALARERIQHEAYSATRRRLYLGGNRYFKILDKAMEQETFRPVLVCGQSGAGKSALLSNWVSTWSRQHPDAVVLVHHLGCGPDAANPVRMLTRLMEEIARRTGDVFQAGMDSDKVFERLPESLAQASAWAHRKAREFLIVLDGLDKVTGPTHLRWLPNHLPLGVKLVVSCLDGDTLEVVRTRLDWNEFTVKPFTKTEVKQLIEGYLGRYRKSLTVKQTRAILIHPLSTNPLFLLTTLEELRVFGVHERLEARLSVLLSSPPGRSSHTEPTVEDAFEHVLARIEEDLGRKAVQSALQAIWASRAGLYQDELLAVAKLAPAQWAAIQNSLDESLYDNGGKIQFGHDYLHRAVARRYGLRGKAKHRIHRSLAKWFSVRDTDARVAEELPWQWREAQCATELKRCLLRSRLFLELFGKDRYELLQYWLGLKTAHAGREYEAAWSTWRQEVRGAAGMESLAESLGTFLAEAAHYGSFTEKLFLLSLKHKVRRFGARHPITFKTRLGLADLLKDSGDFTESERLYRSALKSPQVGPEEAKILFLEAQNNLGLLLVERDEHTEAGRLLDASLKGHVAAFGEQHPRTLATLNNLGLLAERARNYTRAGECYRRAHAGLLAFHGEHHPQVLLTLGNIASISDLLGEEDEARRLYTKAHAGLRRLLGSEHPFSVNTSNNLACLEFVAGNSEAAGKLFGDVVSIYRRTLNQRHPLLLRALDNLGHVCFRTGDLSLAVRNFEESYTGRRELLGSDHEDTLSSRYNLALSLKKSGAVEKAIEVLLEDGEPVDASHGYLLSRCECLLGRFDDAVKHLKQSLSLEPEILRKALLENDLMPIIDRVQKD